MAAIMSDILSEPMAMNNWSQLPRRYDMNGRSQMQGGKNWILPKEINANRFFWDSHWLEIWKNHCCPSRGPTGGSVATDSGWSKQDFAERDKSKPVLLRLSLAGNLEKLLMSLYGTEWWECGYGLWYLSRTRNWSLKR
jgi:hypothetical protein